MMLHLNKVEVRLLPFSTPRQSSVVIVDIITCGGPGRVLYCSSFVKLSRHYYHGDKGLCNSLLPL